MIKDLKEDHPFVYYVAMNAYDTQRGGNGSFSELHHFAWSNTEEGHDIWSKVDKGQYEDFYRHHGRDIKTGQLQPNQETHN